MQRDLSEVISSPSISVADEVCSLSSPLSGLSVQVCVSVCFFCCSPLYSTPLFAPKRVLDQVPLRAQMPTGPCEARQPLHPPRPSRGLGPTQHRPPAG